MDLRSDTDRQMHYAPTIAAPSAESLSPILSPKLGTTGRITRNRRTFLGTKPQVSVLKVV